MRGKGGADENGRMMGLTSVLSYSHFLVGSAHQRFLSYMHAFRIIATRGGIYFIIRSMP